MKSTNTKCRGESAVVGTVGSQSQTPDLSLSPKTTSSLPSFARLDSRGQLSLRATQALFGIVQGGMDLALRKESAERTVEIGFPGYAIGGLSVGEPRALTREVVESTLEHLPKTSPAI